jgi:F0F1-type ATP synthase epsilon subunit
MSQYLSEAFKKLNFLNEETFSITDSGLDDFIKFEEEDEYDDTVDVIDAEAETIEDLEDSYVGKVILDCCVCHSKLYKDVEDVVIEDDIANANEECPFCYTTDGFKVVGQVAEFGEEEKEETTDEDTEEIKETDDEESEELEEGIFGKKKSEKTIKASQLKKGDLIVATEDGRQDKPLKVKNVGENGGSVAIDFPGGNMSISPDEDVTILTEGIFGFKTKKEKEKEAKAKAEKEAQKQRDKEDAERREKQRQQDVIDSWTRYDKSKRDAEKEYNRNRYNGIKGDKPSNTGYRGVNYSGGDYYSESINEDACPHCGRDIADYHSKNVEVSNKSTATWKRTIIIPGKGKFHFKEEYDGFAIYDCITYQKYVFTNNRLTILCDSYNHKDLNDIKDIIDNYNETGKLGVRAYSGGDYVYISESINEDINNITLDTDDSHMEVNQDENGKVTISTEPIANANPSEEVIAPVEPEVQNEISDNVADGEEIEIDMDEFDEESFDELGESYIKRVYENVNSFKTSNVSFIKDKLILEGVINFTSGKSKKTNFVFGMREATKSGKVRFIGENKEIARGRKSFTITGSIQDKKFLSESLNYNYGVKGANGKAQRLYGTVKRGR